MGASPYHSWEGGGGAGNEATVFQPDGVPIPSSLGCLSMPMAAIFQFVPFYHIFHDFYGVHTEVCVGVMVAVYAIIAWSGDRVNEPDARPPQGKIHFSKETISWYHLEVYHNRC